MPRKRVLTKADSGPGRFDDEFLAQSRTDGFHHFPGLPNGTEIGAEMDQLFGYHKSLIYANTDKLWSKRCEVDGPNVQLSNEDFVSCIFGLDVVMKNGDTVTLVDAFSEAFSREKIREARDKVGYAPATRNSLKSGTSFRRLLSFVL